MNRTLFQVVVIELSNAFKGNFGDLVIKIGMRGVGHDELLLAVTFELLKYSGRQRG